MLDKMTQEFANCDHYFIISSQHTIIGNRQPYIGFIGLMRALHNVVMTNGKPRSIVWVVDEGFLLNGIFTTEDAKKFDNLQQLRSRLYALALLDPPVWDWVAHHAAVYVRKATAHSDDLDILLGDWLPESWGGRRREIVNVGVFCRDMEVRCFEFYLEDNVLRMERLPDPGDEFKGAIDKLQDGQLPHTDLYTLTPTSFIEAY